MGIAGGTFQWSRAAGAEPPGARVGAPAAGREGPSCSRCAEPCRAALCPCRTRPRARLLGGAGGGGAEHRRRPGGDGGSGSAGAGGRQRAGHQGGDHRVVPVSREPGEGAGGRGLLPGHGWDRGCAAGLLAASRCPPLSPWFEASAAPLSPGSSRCQGVCPASLCPAATLPSPSWGPMGCCHRARLLEVTRCPHPGLRRGTVPRGAMPVGGG